MEYTRVKISYIKLIALYEAIEHVIKGNEIKTYKATAIKPFFV